MSKGSRRPRGAATEAVEGAQTQETIVKSEGNEQAAVEDVAPERGAFDVATLPPAEQYMGEGTPVATPIPPDPGTAPVQPIPVPPEVAQREAQADKSAKADKGHVRVYTCTRGGQPCNLKLQIAEGREHITEPGTHRVIQMGKPSEFIEFGSGGNPPGVFRTSDAKLQCLIEASEKYKNGQIRRSDSQKVIRRLAAIETLIASGDLPATEGATIKQRLMGALKGMGVPTVQGARTTRNVAIGGVNQPFVDEQGRILNPMAQRLLANAPRVG